MGYKLLFTYKITTVIARPKAVAISWYDLTKNII